MTAPYRIDDDGFLENPEDWEPAFAQWTAERAQIVLTDAHWELIQQARAFYREYGFSPSMRPLVKYIGMHLGPDKGRSIYLMQLFAPSPARLLSQLAGLHKPKNCL